MKTMTQQEPTLRLLAQGRPKNGSPVRCWAFGKTDQGLVRKANEDQFLVARVHRDFEVVQCGFVGATRVQSSPGLLLVVADGVGSVEGSAVAGASAIDSVAESLFHHVPWLHGSKLDQSTFSQVVQAALRHCQKKLIEVAERKHLDPRIATTLTLAYVHWPHLYLAHVGDSRAYVLRGKRMMRLTRDHTLAQQLADSGSLRPSEVESSPFANTLTRCVGGSQSQLQVDAQHLELQREDVLLLCTDGLYREVSETRIAEKLTYTTRGVPTSVCADSLIEQALSAGGRDNVTAVVARFA